MRTCLLHTRALLLCTLDVAHLHTPFAGAQGLLAHEPAVDPRLLALPNVILIPHLGSATVEGRGAAGQRLIANVRFWIDGHRPPDQVLEGWA